MQITPRYDGPPLVEFVRPVGDIAAPVLRQRRRLGEVLAGLDAAQWDAPTRCEAWTVRDVIAHLAGTNQFWVLSATSALAGTPTRFLEGFDPVATPAQLVDRTKDSSADDVLAGYLEGVDALAACLEGLDEQQWSATAEAPPGHVPLHAMARHAIWDSWVHERDILLPLGVAPDEEPDEVLLCLEYAAALGPAFLAMNGSTRRATLVVDGTDPTAHIVVELGPTVVVGAGQGDGDGAGAVRVEGPSVELVEALSFRAPLHADVADDDQWIFGGLAQVFDLA